MLKNQIIKVLVTKNKQVIIFKNIYKFTLEILSLFKKSNHKVFVEYHAIKYAKMYDDAFMH